MTDNPPIHARFYHKRSGFTLDVDLLLPGKGVTVILGASGSGKTSLLRCMAGLDRPDSGYLSVNGQVWLSDNTCLPAYRRPIGYVFQEDSLFAHLTVQQNILFGCHDRSGISDELMPVIELLGISHLLDRKPASLSGGERQRVAIARALAIQPQLLLMDEPLSSLDAERKSEVLPYLEEIRDCHQIPIIYVTHDSSEAERLATHRITIHDGSIVDEPHTT